MPGRACKSPSLQFATYNPSVGSGQQSSMILAKNKVQGITDMRRLLEIHKVVFAAKSLPAEQQLTLEYEKLR
jgi:hypothetical protein